MVSSRIPKIDHLSDDLPSNTGCLIAYSGGADSTALLHLFAETENVCAIHINHHLSPNADSWENHCRKTCKSLGIPIIVEHARLEDSSENTCRKARYNFFAKHMKPGRVLLTAHHAQDQAETVLLKLFRGTGINGLSGINRLQPYAGGYIFRPLLEFGAEELKIYLTEKNIGWIEDESNLNSKYSRNFLRNEILPKLEQKIPNVLTNINKSADNINHSYQLLSWLLKFENKYIEIDKLISVPEKLRISTLYHWLSEKNLPVPDSNTLKQIFIDFTTARADKKPYFYNLYYQLFRYNHRIYCIKKYKKLNSSDIWNWNSEDEFVLPNNCGIIKYKGNKKRDFKIRFNLTGQKISPYHQKITKSVKNLFRENQIPPWAKQNTPYIFYQDKLVSLGYDWSNTDEFKNKIEFNPKSLII